MSLGCRRSKAFLGEIMLNWIENCIERGRLRKFYRRVIYQLLL